MIPTDYVHLFSLFAVMLGLSLLNLKLAENAFIPMYHNSIGAVYGFDYIPFFLISLITGVIAGTSMITLGYQMVCDFLDSMKDKAISIEEYEKLAARGEKANLLVLVAENIEKIEKKEKGEKIVNV